MEIKQSSEKQTPVFPSDPKIEKKKKKESSRVMSVHLEIGYIGLDRPSMETFKQLSFSTDHETTNMKKDGLTLVETELRLGPLGSQSPDQYPKGVLTTSQCGVKRGFCEAIDDSKKWGVFGSHDSEFHLRKEALLFSSNCNLENNAKHSSFETPSPSPNLVHEMKSRQPFLNDSGNGITSGK
ncbi:hypothetical protein F0562_012479 [Nyssa sinensis]|uniref:Uncharacterized protein n=1 Tax=Nyssa sinensis TaxID=561372 RepID=A0A5J4ZVL8_9ASTE|nr:hypothetical protein F0562_012479 [Nyssa sinensis]